MMIQTGAYLKGGFKMLRGIDPKQYYRYIPEVELEAEKPTAFWVRSQTGREINKWLTEYASAGTAGRKGKVTYQDRKLEQIDVEQFCSVVNKVENFELLEEGKYKYCEIIEDPKLIAEVARQMDPTVRQEILSVSQDMSRLEESSKKD